MTRGKHRRSRAAVVDLPPWVVVAVVLTLVVGVVLTVRSVAGSASKPASGSSGDPHASALSVRTTSPSTTGAVPSQRVSSAAARPTTSTTTIVPTTSTTVAGPAPVRNLPVIKAEIPIVDPSRSLIRSGVRLASRRELPTTVWSPSGSGRYPLVVFAHGYQLGPEHYERFCRQLASAGYVVAAPSFPLADAARQNGLDRGDIPNEALDVGVVITQVRASLAGLRIAEGPVAVVGHSDGADVALLAGYGSGYLDRRVAAVVSIAPDAMTVARVASTSPLLLVQGDADSIVPYSNSREVFAQVPAPRDYLTMLGADHLPPIAGPSQWTPVLDEAVAAFLDATLAHRTSTAGLAASLGASPLVRLQQAP